METVIVHGHVTKDVAVHGGKGRLPSEETNSDSSAEQFHSQMLVGADIEDNARVRVCLHVHGDVDLGLEVNLRHLDVRIVRNEGNAGQLLTLLAREAWSTLAHVV